MRRHPTVVSLDHLDSPDASWITSAYYLTRDVRNHLEALQHALDEPAGCGMFVVGQYGSGKSHFLAYVTRSLGGGALRNGDSAGVAPAADRVDNPLAGLSVKVLAISLLEYRAERVLEDIVLEALDVDPVSGDRRDQWTRLANRYSEGLLLVIDELSEFLRSKPDRARFHEDVRFLQFLGEWAQGHRLWVLAAVQEQIEHTGDLEYAMYRKIKDRYPLRFLLTPAHVVDLLSESILVKKEGYQESVEQVVEELREAFPTFATNYDEFRLIFPIHPATLELLEEVRDRFSQARGVVDFTVGQLSGSVERKIPAFLDRPWNSLLTPDLIIDHFGDLFEMQPEFVPLAQQLLPYYRRHLSEIFETERLVELAWRVIKLLMLTYISPARPGLTAEEAVRWLLYRAARIDPQKNLSIVERVLDSLVEKGRYVALQDGHYALNLEDDGGAALDRFLEREKSEIRGRGAMVFEMLVPLLSDEDFHPFSLAREGWQQRSVRWHFHDRAYSVYLGDRDPPPRDGLTICLRLPWGDRKVVAGVRTVLPSPLEVGEEEIELAALSRARERSWSGKAITRLESRFRERFNFFRSQLRSAYRDATFAGPSEEVETGPHLERADSFNSWLDSVAVFVLRRTYPSFERFAPIHGPLPKEAYRSLMRFVSENDLGQYDADDAVKLIREAYLVPMGLMKRRGRAYVQPGNPEKNELFRLVLPMVETETSTKAIYEQLQGPVYGLVPDQVSLLLVYLLILGEIDILKGKTSYREAFETLPNPLQYDRVVPGRALGLDQIRELVAICDGLSIRLPQQLTVMAQRRASRDLSNRVRERSEPLRKLQVKLKSTRGGEKLAERLSQFLLKMGALGRGDDELQAIQQFLFEVGTATRFLSDLSDFQQLADRIDRLLEELGRYQHLLSHPVVTKWDDTDLALRLEALESPPGLEELDALEAWLRQGRETYETYRESYRQKHAKWWGERASHPIWTWQPDPLAASRHLGLEAEIKALRECRARAAELRCRGLVNLDFQAACHCGFDGESSPVASAIELLEELREKIERSMRHFFGQEKVRERLRKWVEEGIEVNPRTLAYLEEKEPFPEVKNLQLFDRHLAGLELVKQVDAKELLEIVAERTWDRRDLVAAVERYLERFGDTRLRFAIRPSRAADLESWCVEQSLRHGIALPSGLTREDLHATVAMVRPQWVGGPALEHLDQLALGESIENQVITWILEGQVSVPDGTAVSPLVECALEVLRPSDLETPEDLARKSEQFYREHARFLGIARETWLKRLDGLAQSEPAAPLRKLTDVLADFEAPRWIIIDALGLPLVRMVRESLDELFPGWRVETVEYAMVSTKTTTDQCYRELVDEGFRQPLEKINVIDTLIHGRFLPLEDLRQLAQAELSVACRKLRPRLEPNAPLLVFADHGFRIAHDGKAYQHGGDSMLERIVPVFYLAPIS